MRSGLERARMIPAIVSGALAHAGRAAGSTGWISYVASVVVLVGFVVGAPCFWVWPVRRWGLGGDGFDDGDGGGGGGQGRGPTPPSRPPDTDPEWWPEFEHQFAVYVESVLTGSR